MTEQPFTVASDEIWTGPIPGSGWITEALLAAACSECGAPICELVDGGLRYLPGASMTPGIGPRCGDHQEPSAARGTVTP